MARPAKIQKVESFCLSSSADRACYRVRSNLTGYTKLGKIDATVDMSIDQAVGLINDLKAAVTKVKDEVIRVAGNAGL